MSLPRAIDRVAPRDMMVCQLPSRILSARPNRSRATATTPLRRAAPGTTGRRDINVNASSLSATGNSTANILNRSTSLLQPIQHVHRASVRNFASMSADFEEDDFEFDYYLDQSAQLAPFLYPGARPQGLRGNDRNEQTLTGNESNDVNHDADDVNKRLRTRSVGNVDGSSSSADSGGTGVAEVGKLLGFHRSGMEAGEESRVPEEGVQETQGSQTQNDMDAQTEAMEQQFLNSLVHHETPEEKEILDRMMAAETAEEQAFFDRILQAETPEAREALIQADPVMGQALSKMSSELREDLSDDVQEKAVASGDAKKEYISGNAMIMQPQSREGAAVIPSTNGGSQELVNDDAAGHAANSSNLSPTGTYSNNSPGSSTTASTALLDQEEHDPYEGELELHSNRKIRSQFNRRINTDSAHDRELIMAGYDQRKDHLDKRYTQRMKNSPTVFDPTKPVRVRVLDVDQLNLEEVHRLFMYTCVANLPAEKCVKIASRIAQFKDRQSHQSYENLLRYCERYLFGDVHGPELLALFARCHNTLSVAVFLDYIRRYGQFSKGYIAKIVDQSLSPKLFDFVRYEHQGGAKPIPSLITKPYHLSSYTRLLGKSTTKSYLFDQLQKRGHIPINEGKELEEQQLEARMAERLTEIGEGSHMRNGGDSSTQLDGNGSRNDPTLLAAIQRQKQVEAGESYPNAAGRGGKPHQRLATEGRPGRDQANSATNDGHHSNSEVATTIPGSDRTTAAGRMFMAPTEAVDAQGRRYSEIRKGFAGTNAGGEDSVEDIQRTDMIVDPAKKRRGSGGDADAAINESPSYSIADIAAVEGWSHRPRTPDDLKASDLAPRHAWEKAETARHASVFPSLDELGGEDALLQKRAKSRYSSGSQSGKSGGRGRNVQGRSSRDQEMEVARPKVLDAIMAREYLGMEIGDDELEQFSMQEFLGKMHKEEGGENLSIAADGLSAEDLSAGDLAISADESFDHNGDVLSRIRERAEIHERDYSMADSKGYRLEDISEEGYSGYVGGHDGGKELSNMTNAPASTNITNVGDTLTSKDPDDMRYLKYNQRVGDLDGGWEANHNASDPDFMELDDLDLAEMGLEKVRKENRNFSESDDVDNGDDLGADEINLGLDASEDVHDSAKFTQSEINGARVAGDRKPTNLGSTYSGGDTFDDDESDVYSPEYFEEFDKEDNDNSRSASSNDANPTGHSTSESDASNPPKGPSPSDRAAFPMQFERVSLRNTGPTAGVDEIVPVLEARESAEDVNSTDVNNIPHDALAIREDEGAGERWWDLKDRFKFAYNKKLYYIGDGKWKRTDLEDQKPKRRHRTHRVLRGRREVKSAKKEVVIGQMESSPGGGKSSKANSAKVNLSRRTGAADGTDENPFG